MNEVKMNDRVKMTVGWKPLARSRGQRTDKSWCKRLRRKGLFKEKSFELRVKVVKLMRAQGKSISSVEWWRRRRLQLFGYRIPKYKSMVGKRPVSYFETWANWRTLESDDVRGASSTVRLNIEKAVEIRRLFCLKNFVSFRSNFIWDALLNVEPVKRFKN